MVVGTARFIWRSAPDLQLRRRPPRRPDQLRFGCVDDHNTRGTPVHRAPDKTMRNQGSGESQCARPGKHRSRILPSNGENPGSLGPNPPWRPDNGYFRHRKIAPIWRRMVRLGRYRSRRDASPTLFQYSEWRPHGNHPVGDPGCYLTEVAGFARSVGMRVCDGSIIRRSSASGPPPNCFQ